MESTDLDQQLVSGTRRAYAWIEALAVLALGFGLMLVFYGGTVSSPGAQIGVPGHDSFYHIAMASILPEYGAMPDFPWLEYVYFRDQGSAFVSHHWGFHLMLLPFVKLAELTTGDALEGGRWATSAFFGANLLLFHLLLRHKRAPLHWLWIALFFLLPDQFFARHGFVRAIGPSLLFMQLTLLALFARRYWLAGLAVGAYVHLYLGAVMFGPLLVGIHAAALAIGPRDDREWPWRMVAITAAAWALGVVTYPYSGGIFEFLKLQVFGSGLSPDIEVGREWKPYSDAWFLVTMAAPLLAAWVGAIVLRLRTGPRLSAEDTTLLVLQFLFLVLTFKARRFIEYWPPICLLSAAYIAAAPLREIQGSIQKSWSRRSDSSGAFLLGAMLLVVGVAAAGSWFEVGRSADASHLLRNWWVWGGPVFAIAVISTLKVSSTTQLFTVLPSGGVPSDPGHARSLPIPRGGRVALTALLAALIPAAVLAVGSGGLDSAVRQLRCYYDLDEVESMMTFLERSSEPGDVIFTDDWDVFPLFFFHNRHNHYIVGLDPKFTHQREPDLWNRYVKISRGQVPSTIQLASATDGSERATVALEDIREQFGARWVIADRDHQRLSDALANAPELAELAYPEGVDYETARESEYVVFRIRDEEEGAELARLTHEPHDGPLFFGELRPISVSQGWGEFAANQTVDGNDIRLGGVVYRRGLGTHATSRILYDLPPGYAWFEAVVGVDDETNGEGTIVASVLVDGDLIYESPTLQGGGEPAVVRIPIEGARQIQLEATPTEDGPRFDHVSWGEAKLVPGDSHDDRAASADSVGGAR